MRLRTLLALSTASLLLATVSRAQAPDPNADGLVEGNFLRVSAGRMSPINAGGSLKDWKPGYGINVMWENWIRSNSGRMGLLGYAIYADYGRLPFDEEQFVSDAVVTPNGTVVSASAGGARTLQLGVNARLRIPMPYLMPSVGVGFGFFDWHPGEIRYQATNGSGTAKQQYRQGGAITLLAGVDKYVYDRVAIFGEAVYTYAYTSYGQGLGASGSSCVAASCDLLKNTTLGTIRGGLRIRATR